MKKTQPLQPVSMSRRLWLAAAAGLMCILIACGGGDIGSIAGVGSGGTGAVANGSITGFGSIILNGVRFDDATAQITLDDDANGTDADLRLGMTVEVEGDVAADGVTGKATSIVGRSFVRGPISAINMATNEITVLGVAVTVTPNTVYAGEGLSALNNLAVNDVVEIYGLPGGAQALKATRIERMANERRSEDDEHEDEKIAIRLIGIVENATPTRATINGIAVQYRTADLVNLPNGVVDGTLVRIKGVFSAHPAGIVASKVSQVSFVPAIKEGQYADVEGLVTKFTSATDFEMNGLKIGLGNSGKVMGNAALGAHAEVEGTVSNGVLVASRILFRDANAARPDGNEVHGQIQSVDQAGKTFSMRGGTLTVKWDRNTLFDASLPNGEASLAPGSPVHVKGNMAGSVLLATQIGLEAPQK